MSQSAYGHPAESSYFEQQRELLIGDVSTVQAVPIKLKPKHALNWVESRGRLAKH